jgi:hypothetical protein
MSYNQQYAGAEKGAEKGSNRAEKGWKKRRKTLIRVFYPFYPPFPRLFLSLFSLSLSLSNSIKTGIAEKIRLKRGGLSAVPEVPERKKMFAIQHSPPLCFLSFFGGTGGGNLHVTGEAKWKNEQRKL